MANDTGERIRAAFPDVIARIAAGELIRDALKVHALERRDVSYHILRDPEARRLWDEAREMSADSFMDEAMQEARADVDKELAQHVRTRIDTLKWAARIRNPRLYSDKATLDVNVRTVDLTRIIQDANARLAAQQQGRIIDADAVSNNSGSLPAHACAERALTNLVDPALLALL